MSNWVRKEQIFFETRSSHDYFLVFFFYRALSWKTSFQLDLRFCRKSLSGVMTHIPCRQIQSKLSNFKMQWRRVQFEALLSGLYTLITVRLVSFKIFIISHISFVIGVFKEFFSTKVQSDEFYDKLSKSDKKKWKDEYKEDVAAYFKRSLVTKIGNATIKMLRFVSHLSPIISGLFNMNNT